MQVPAVAAGGRGKAVDAGARQRATVRVTQGGCGASRGSAAAGAVVVIREVGRGGRRGRRVQTLADKHASVTGAGAITHLARRPQPQRLATRGRHLLAAARAPRHWRRATARCGVPAREALPAGRVARGPRNHPAAAHTNAASGQHTAAARGRLCVCSSAAHVLDRCQASPVEERRRESRAHSQAHLPPPAAAARGNPPAAAGRGISNSGRPP